MDGFEQDNDEYSASLVIPFDVKNKTIKEVILGEKELNVKTEDGLFYTVEQINQEGMKRFKYIEMKLPKLKIS